MTTLRFDWDAVYEECRPAIARTTRWFAKAHGGDLDELRAEANLAFVKAKIAWTREVEQRGEARSPFKYYVRYRVYKELYQRARVLERQRAAREVSYSGELDPEEGGSFDLDAFVAGLGDDAAAAVRLAFSAGAPVTPVAAEGRLVRALRAMGWAARRITAAWDEVREALA